MLESNTQQGYTEEMPVSGAVVDEVSGWCFFV